MLRPRQAASLRVIPRPPLPRRAPQLPHPPLRPWPFYAQGAVLGGDAGGDSHSRLALLYGGQGQHGQRGERKQRGRRLPSSQGAALPLPLARVQQRQPRWRRRLRAPGPVRRAPGVQQPQCNDRQSGGPGQRCGLRGCDMGCAVRGRRQRHCCAAGGMQVGSGYGSECGRSNTVLQATQRFNFGGMQVALLLLSGPPIDRAAPHCRAPVCACLALASSSLLRLP